MIFKGYVATKVINNFDGKNSDVLLNLTGVHIEIDRSNYPSKCIDFNGFSSKFNVVVKGLTRDKNGKLVWVYFLVGHIANLQEFIKHVSVMANITKDNIISLPTFESYKFNKIMLDTPELLWDNIVIEDSFEET